MIYLQRVNRTLKKIAVTSLALFVHSNLHPQLGTLEETKGYLHMLATGLKLIGSKMTRARK